MNFKKITTIYLVIIPDSPMKKSNQILRVITKILKLDENNQYGFGMAKPLPTVFLKENLDTSWRTVNFILQNVSLSDQIGHLYVIDIEFDHTKATEKQKVYN